MTENNVTRVKCDKEYIGELARTSGERLKEHFMVPFPIYDHFNITGHQYSLDNFSIEGRESHIFTRTIKEAIYIRMIHQSIETLESTSHCTYWIKSYSAPQI